MGSEPSEAFATRLPVTEAEQLEMAIDETGLTRSAFVRRAISYYVTENPDHIAALHPEDSLERLTRELVE